MEATVIIPVYNGEKFIKNAIKSVLNQTFEDLEILVIDDASTDRTVEIVEESFKDILNGKLRIIKNPKNMERSYSRNIGVENTKGKFVFFLDYDDEWEREYIEQSISYLKDNDIVYSFPRTFIDEDSKIIRVSKKTIPEDVGKIIFSGQIGYPSASGFRKESFLGYREDIILREDWEIFIRSYLKGIKIKILDNNKVFMREHRNRTSRNIKMLYSTLKVYEDYKDKIPKKYKADFLFHIADINLRFGNLSTGWKILFRAIKENPSIILDKRNILSVLKRGFRIDRFLDIKGGI
ncbi:MAG: glycosyltransferase [Hydrogenothermaceae bacterium]|nr:glycosyltransferase [Hydrogenothermaceae bacterium]